MVRFHPYQVFGWRLHKVTMERGDTLVTEVSVNTLRAEADTINLYTKGGISVSCTAPNKYHLGQRKVGEFSRDRINIKAGTYVSTAEEPVEIWCVNYTINKKQLPNLVPLRLTAGESLEIPADSRLLICHGCLAINGNDIQGPETVTFSQARLATAVTDCFGLFFDRER